jgi:hypothetical protein
MLDFIPILITTTENVVTGKIPKTWGRGDDVAILPYALDTFLAMWVYRF